MSKANKHRKVKETNNVVRAIGVVGAGATLSLVAATSANAASVSTWDKVAQCESSGDWAINHSSDGMSVGGLQFQNASWKTALAYLNTKGVNTSSWTQNLYQGMPRDKVPTKSQQIAAAEALLKLQANPWAASSSCAGFYLSQSQSMFNGGTNPFGLSGSSVPAALGGIVATPVTPKPATPVVSSTGTRAAAQAVAYAKSKISTAAYLWGGNGPVRFDCSGLVTQAWKSAGVTNIPRTTQQMAASGLPRVSKSNLRPGDLIVFTFSSYADHVGMYVGKIGPNGADMIDTASRHPNGGVNWSTLATRGGSIATIIRPDGGNGPKVTPAPTTKPVTPAPKPVTPKPTVPKTAPAPHKPVKDSSPSTTKTHVVVRGDTLWDLAQKYLGNHNWQAIYNANKSKIADPHWIYPGQTLVIPGTIGK